MTNSVEWAFPNKLCFNSFVYNLDNWGDSKDTTNYRAGLETLCRHVPGLFEKIDWLRANAKGKWHAEFTFIIDYSGIGKVAHGVAFVFADSKDAVFFKLAAG